MDERFVHCFSEVETYRQYIGRGQTVLSIVRRLSTL